MLMLIKKIFYSVVVCIELLAACCLDSESDIPMIVFLICGVILFIGMYINWDSIVRSVENE